MQLGAPYSLGVGFTPTAEDYARVAQSAEELGYDSLWLADHIVIPEKIAAPYPWTEDGSVGFPREVYAMPTPAQNRTKRLRRCSAAVEYRRSRAPSRLAGKESPWTVATVSLVGGPGRERESAPRQMAA